MKGSKASKTEKQRILKEQLLVHKNSSKSNRTKASKLFHLQRVKVWQTIPNDTFFQIFPTDRYLKLFAL